MQFTLLDHWPEVERLRLGDVCEVKHPVCLFEQVCLDRNSEYLVFGHPDEDFTFTFFEECFLPVFRKELFGFTEWA